MYNIIDSLEGNMREEAEETLAWLENASSEELAELAVWLVENNAGVRVR